MRKNCSILLTLGKIKMHSICISIIRGQRTHRGLGTLVISSSPPHAQKKGIKMQTLATTLQNHGLNYKECLFYLLFYFEREASSNPHQKLETSLQQVSGGRGEKNPIMQSTFLNNSVKLAISAFMRVAMVLTQFTTIIDWDTRSMPGSWRH